MFYHPNRWIRLVRNQHDLNEDRIINPNWTVTLTDIWHSRSLAPEAGHCICIDYRVFYTFIFNDISIRIKLIICLSFFYCFLLLPKTILRLAKRSFITSSCRLWRRWYRYIYIQIKILFKQCTELYIKKLNTQKEF